MEVGGGRIGRGGINDPAKIAAVKPSLTMVP